MNMNIEIRKRGGSSYLALFIIRAILCSVLLCSWSSTGHAQINEDDPLELSKNFYALSPHTNRNRGYDSLGELPQYKWEITSAFISQLYTGVVSNNFNLSSKEENRVEAHCVGDDYPESLSRGRGIGFQSSALSGRENHFTQDVFQEIHLGKGEITTHLNSYLSRCYPDENLKETTSMPPYWSIPYLSITGDNTWIEYSDKLVELYKTFFLYHNAKSNGGEVVLSIEQYLRKSQVKHIQQHYNLYSSRKERILLKILTTSLDHDSLWILLWKHTRKAHHHELPSLKMQSRDDNQVHFILSSESKQFDKLCADKHMDDRENKTHFPEQRLLEIEANEWSVKAESPEWKKSSEVHSAHEILKCDKLYVQRILLKSQSGEEITVDIILAFETYRGELYQLAWGQESLSSGSIYYHGYSIRK